MRMKKVNFMYLCLEVYNYGELHDIICFHTLYKTKRFFEEKIKFSCLLPNVVQGDLSTVIDTLNSITVITPVSEKEILIQ